MSRSTLHLDKKGQVAIITGGANGIGLGCAAAFLREGADVALFDMNQAALSAARAELEAIGAPGRVLDCVVNVTDEASVMSAVKTVTDTFGRVDILVYSTGTNIPDRSVERLTTDTWDMMVATNLNGAFYCTKAVVPIMREQGDGTIIYISSGCVQFPDTSGVSYQATKHGMKGLSYGTLKEEKENGIRTSVIFPGLCDTPLVIQRPVKTPDDVLAQALQPQDVADACLYVATLPARACVPELVLLPAGLA